MMTTAQALIGSGILTLLMLLVASAFCAKVWTPPGVQVAFGNRERHRAAARHGGPRRPRREEPDGGMVMFLALVLAAQIAGKGAQAANGATIFFWARLVYWPVYLAGIIYLRTRSGSSACSGFLIIWEVW